MVGIRELLLLFQQHTINIILELEPEKSLHFDVDLQRNATSLRKCAHVRIFLGEFLSPSGRRKGLYSPTTKGANFLKRNALLGQPK